MNSILRPSTPPFSFSALKRACAPSAMLAYADAGPLNGYDLPSLIDRSVIPGVASAPPPLPALTPPSSLLRPHPLASTRADSATIDNHRMVSSFSRPDPGASRQADHSRRQHVHEE